MFVTPFRRSVPGYTFRGILLAGGLLCLASFSCIKETPPRGRESLRQNKKERCQSQIESILDLSRPEKLGTKSRLVDIENRLNDWLRDCETARQRIRPLGEKTRRLWTPLAATEGGKRLARPIFEARDVRHIRNSLLLGSLRDEIVRRRSEPNDKLSRAVDMFYFVVRNVELVDRHTPPLPLPLFRILLLGRGTAEDRAWIFAALLRQEHIPAVILQPKTPPEKTERPAPFVLGVLLDGKIYLFDTRLGLPLPSSQDDGKTLLPRTPATLRELLAEDEITRRLQVGKFRYPFSSADWQSLWVQPVGQRSLWAPRIRALVKPLAGRCVVYTPLDEDPEIPGLLQPILAAGKGLWTEKDVRLWPYAEKVYRRFEEMDDEAQAQMQELFRPFEVPIQFRPTSSGEIVEGASLWLQMRSRIDQLAGRYSNAVKRYVNVRIAARPAATIRRQLPAVLRQPMDRAYEDASFWIGLCKFEQYARLRTREEIAPEERARLLESAVASLSAYLNAEEFTRWKRQCQFVLALCRAEQKKFRTARTLMRTLADSGHPQAHGFALLLRRWEEQTPADQGLGTKKKPTPKKSAGGKTAPKTTRQNKTAPGKKHPGRTAPVPAPKPKSLPK